MPDLVWSTVARDSWARPLAALDEVGLDEVVPVISLAKREEEIFRAGPRLSRCAWTATIPPASCCNGCATRPTGSPSASTGRRRSARTTDSLLDELPGVGEKRKPAILQHFGSPERFLQASARSSRRCPGLPGKVAREIYDYVHKTG